MKSGNKNLTVTKIICYAVMGALLAFATEIIFMIIANNTHLDSSKRVYRSAQMNSEELNSYIIENDIKTVINLRGRPISAWYTQEALVTQLNGINQEDITLSASRLPTSHEVLRLIYVFDKTEYPVLLHCKQGADRTGLAMALYCLLYTDTDLSTAMKHCSPRYGHFPFFKRGEIDRFFEMYSAWLSGRSHTASRFRDWITNHYQPGNAVANLEFHKPRRRFISGRKMSLHLKATNLSRESWYFRECEDHTAVKVRVTIDGPGLRIIKQIGYTEECIKPGQSIEFDVSHLYLTNPGQYHITADLVYRGFSFAQFGSSIAHHQFEVLSDSQKYECRLLSCDCCINN